MGKNIGTHMCGIICSVFGFIILAAVVSTAVGISSAYILSVALFAFHPAARYAANWA